MGSSPLLNTSMSIVIVGVGGSSHGVVTLHPSSGLRKLDRRSPLPPPWCSWPDLHQGDPNPDVGGVEVKVGVKGCRDPLTPFTQLLPGGFLPSVASFDNFQGYSLFLGGLAIALFPDEAHKRATEALLLCSNRWGEG